MQFSIEKKIPRRISLLWHGGNCDYFPFYSKIPFIWEVVSVSFKFSDRKDWLRTGSFQTQLLKQEGFETSITNMKLQESYLTIKKFLILTLSLFFLYVIFYIRQQSTTGFLSFNRVYIKDAGERYVKIWYYFNAHSRCQRALFNNFL